MKMKNKKNTPEYHREIIAIKTLKMNSIMSILMCGPNHEEATTYLKSIGYTDNQLEKL